MQPRSLFFWCHLAAGVVAGVVIFIMSLTGALLTYERQLIEWSDRAYRSTPSTDAAQRLPVETLLQRLSEQRPDAPTAITVRSDPAAPVAVAFGQATVYQDAFSGRIIGAPSTDVRRLMSQLRAWHRWLALDGEGRAIGRAISGWSNVVFLFIVLSGIYLWLPRKWTWQHVRAAILFRGGLSGKARDFNWHNVIGIWSAVPLALIVATAAPISFPWANALVYRIAGEAPPAPQTAALRDGAGRPERRPAQRVHTEGLNALWTRAEQQEPDWRSINLRLSTSADVPAVFAIDSGTGGQPQLRSTLTLARATGDVVKWEPFASQSLGRRLRSWTRFTHTGEYYGLTGQTIAGLISAGATVLVFTGLSLSVRRFLGWRRKPESLNNARRDQSKSEAA